MQRVLAAVAALEDRATRVAVEAERAFLRALGGGCQTPAAAYATLEGDTLRLRGMVANPDGSGLRRGRDQRAVPTRPTSWARNWRGAWHETGAG